MLAQERRQGQSATHLEDGRRIDDHQFQTQLARHLWLFGGPKSASEKCELALIRNSSNGDDSPAGNNLKSR